MKGNERLFLVASVPLQLTFGAKRVTDRAVGFEKDEKDRPPAGGVLGAPPAVMYFLPRAGITRITGVQRPIRAAQHVDEVCAVGHKIVL